jgi:hypothetical protein
MLEKKVPRETQDIRDAPERTTQAKDLNEVKTRLRGSTELAQELVARV